MAHRKGYGQFCALARGLDVVGDRWTLLVVRELLLGPRSFRELQEGLRGASPNLLTDRLRTLRRAGLVARNDAPARSRAVLYSLTEEGRELEPAVLELIRWGARWMVSGPGRDRVEPRWAMLALRALLEGPAARVPGPEGAGTGVVHLTVAGSEVTVELADGRRVVVPGHRGRADAQVEGSMPDVLAVASGGARPEAALRVRGDRVLAAAVLAPLRTPPSAGVAEQRAEVGQRLRPGAVVDPDPALGAVE